MGNSLASHVHLPASGADVVLVGGGHANVQVLKILAEKLRGHIDPSSWWTRRSSEGGHAEEDTRRSLSNRPYVRLTLINDTPTAFYSG